MGKGQFRHQSSCSALTTKSSLLSKSVKKTHLFSPVPHYNGHTLLLISDLPDYKVHFSQESIKGVAFLLTEERELTWVMSTCDFFCHGLKNILQQHLLLEGGQSDISVAKQPLWLLFCCAGPLTRYSVKVASVWSDSFATLGTWRNQRKICSL